MVEFDGEDDPVHLLVNYHPKMAVSNLVNRLKRVSSRMILQKQDRTIRKKLWGEGCGCQATPTEAAVALRCPSFADTSNNNRRPVEASFPRRALDPRPEGRGFPRYSDKNPREWKGMLLLC